MQVCNAMPQIRLGFSYFPSRQVEMKTLHLLRTCKTREFLNGLQKKISCVATFAQNSALQSGATVLKVHEHKRFNRVDLPARCDEGQC